METGQFVRANSIAEAMLLIAEAEQWQPGERRSLVLRVLAAVRQWTNPVADPDDRVEQAWSTLGTLSQSARGKTGLVLDRTIELYVRLVLERSVEAKLFRRGEMPTVHARLATDVRERSARTPDRPGAADVLR